MVNLTIRLGKAGAGTSSGGGKQEQAGGTNSAITTKGLSIPSHLVDTDLPLLKGVGTVFSEPCAVNFVGVKARRRPGDKVHICVRCNFPIAVYGRLIPCEHVFCLTCAKLDPACFLCEERVTRIQKMDVLEGIYICGAPGCLRSFLARPDFDLHISEAHPQLLPLEQGRLLSPERNVSAGNNAVPEAQVQSHQSGQQQYAEQFAPPVQQPSGNPLQVIFPKKEETQQQQQQQQRRPPKVVRQDHPQGGLLGRPVPELRLPDQFPHHRGGDHQHLNHERGGSDTNSQGRDPQQKLRRRSEWDATMQVPEFGREGGMHEDERERLGDNHAGRKKEKDGDKDKGPPSPLFPNPKDVPQKQKEGSLPPPPLYPPLTNFASPAYLPQQDGKNSFSSPPPYPPPRGFHPGMPMVGSRHEGFGGPHGYGHQNGPPRPMNGTNNNALDYQFGGHTRPRPHFYPEYGPPPMGMPPRGVPRYHEGHLPPPPPGPPPPKRAKFNGQGEPIMDYNQWGNPGNFGGHPGGHAYPNWMPPANS